MLASPEPEVAVPQAFQKNEMHARKICHAPNTIDSALQSLQLWPCIKAKRRLRKTQISHAEINQRYAHKFAAQITTIAAFRHIKR